MIFPLCIFIISRLSTRFSPRKDRSTLSRDRNPRSHACEFIVFVGSAIDIRNGRTIVAVALRLCCPFFQKVGGLFTISLFLFLPAKKILSKLVVYLLLLEVQMLTGVNTIVLINLFINGIFCWLSVDGSLHGLFRSFATLCQILSLFRL